MSENLHIGLTGTIQHNSVLGFVIIDDVTFEIFEINIYEKHLLSQFNEFYCVVNKSVQYLFLDNGDVRYKVTDKVADKCEDLGYYLDNKKYLKIDFLSYIQRQLMKPVDEILLVGVTLNGLIEEQFHLRLLKKKYIYKLNDLFNPLKFEI